MQSVSALFEERMDNDVRQLSWQFAASFDKVFDPSITFFILDTSLLDGNDLLAPEGNNTLTEWQKYLYIDYSDRVISIEWINEYSFFFSVTASMADIQLDNHDDFFTRGSDSPIASYLLPRRPIKLLAGLSGENIPEFVGLTEQAPVVDRGNKTASLHAQDFLRYIFDRKLDQTVMLEDQRVDQILKSLFNSVGVLDSQMNLDVARTTVPFAFFEKDTTVGNAVENLMKAEMGSLYMDEEGTIIFKSRLRLYSDTPVATYNEDNVIDYDTSNETQIVNSVVVKSQIREVQSLQLVYSSITPLLIPAGGSVEFFFDFQDPVTTVEAIDGYIANTSQYGDGDDITDDVTVTDTDLFSTSIKVVFANANASNAYITLLNILGTPARVVKTVDIIEKDQTSIDEFEEQTMEISSPYIQDKDNAESIALTIIRHFKDYGSVVTLYAVGNPALQVSDVVSVQLDSIDDTFVVSKIENMLSLSKGFIQRITAQKYDIPHYFILDQSLLNGEDVLAA